MNHSPAWLRAAFTLACAAALFGLHAANQVSGDEGIVINGAWNIVNGRKLYIDFFEYIPPGAFYFFAAPWALFGSNYWTAKIVAVAVIAAGAFGVWKAASLLASSSASKVPAPALLAAPLIFCLLSAPWSPINHNTLNIAILVGACYFGLRCIAFESRRDALWAGVLSGIAATVLLHRSAAFVAAFALLLAWRFLLRRSAFHGQALALFLLPACALPMGLLLFWSPALLYDSLIVFPATRYIEVNRVDFSLFWLLMAVLGSVAWVLRSVRSDTVRLVLLFQLLLALTALQRTDFAYVTLVVFPLVIASPLLFTRARGHGIPQPASTRMLAGGGLLFVLALAAPGALKIATKPALVEDRSASLQTLQYIREHCKDDPFIYAGPFLPGFYFEARKLNPTRYSILLTNFSRDEQFIAARKTLEANPPRCVVTAYEMMEPFGHRTDNPVDSFISSAYKVALSERTLKLWVLK